MPYQLVLQFRGDSLDELDAIVALEDSFIEQLGDTAEVGGHDIGLGEATSLSRLPIRSECLPHFGQL